MENCIISAGLIDVLAIAVSLIVGLATVICLVDGLINARW